MAQRDVGKMVIGMVIVRLDSDLEWDRQEETHTHRNEMRHM